jgi:hypothetical protein
MRMKPMLLAFTLTLLSAPSVVEATEAAPPATSDPVKSGSPTSEPHPDEVLDWNHIFIDTLIAAGTPNSSSQRLGAIVHTAIFDAYNGIQRRYSPIFVHDEAPAGASRRAAVIAAAYETLVVLFPSREARLTERYEASLAALSRRPCSTSARTTASPPPIPRSLVGPRSASGGRHRRRSRR